MQERSLARTAPLASLAVTLGWGTIGAGFLLALPQEWKTGAAAAGAFAAGLAWLALVTALVPFFAPAPREGSRAAARGLRLGVALAYAASTAFISFRFAMPPRPVPEAWIIAGQAAVSALAALGAIAAGLVGAKARDMESSESAARQGLDEIRSQLEALCVDLSLPGAPLSALRADVERLRDRLRYTSPSREPEALSSEARIAEGVQRLRGWIQFLRSLRTGDAQIADKLKDMQDLVASLEQEAVRRGRISSQP